jgi:ribonuclease HI
MNALIMEAGAVHEGIRPVHDMGLQRFILETDALEVFNLVKEERTGRSIIVIICQEIKDHRVSSASFNITHVNRSANEAAHACAHRASPERRRCMWINFPPPFLARILVKDCNPVT